MGIDLLPDFIREHYEAHEWKHACAILKQDFRSEWQDIVEVLSDFRLRKSWLVDRGKNKSRISGAIDDAFYGRGWKEKGFSTQVLVDGVAMDAPTHKVDCFKNRVALEIEWNNKDPFFDRDLNNFRLLFDLRAISVGVIVTRCDEIQDIVNSLGRGTSFGASTTHMSKLLPRIQGIPLHTSFFAAPDRFPILRKVLIFIDSTVRCDRRAGERNLLILYDVCNGMHSGR